jgi:arylsulfatase B/arylsulfatase I/J
LTKMTEPVGEVLLTYGEQERPHIIFIVADDLGWHDISFQNSGIETPAIDRLARQGRFLENYYVQPTCAPTRASIMTGRHVTSHGITYPFDNGIAMGLNLSETLLPEVLSFAGYSTHAVGKWHLGFFKSALTPTFRGFDSFYGFYGEGEDYFSHVHQGAFDFRFDNGRNCGFGCSIVDTTASGQYSTTLFARRALNIISNHDARQPLFLYYSLQAVHAPVPAYCPDEMRAKLKGSRRKRSFACALMLADQSIGDIVHELEQKDMLKRSIIVFSSDNGGAISTTDWRSDDSGSSNWPLRGGKHTLFEGGVRVVGCVWTGWWTRDNQHPYPGVMGSVDWFPTLLDAAHITRTPKKLEGVSHWRALAFEQEPPQTGMFIAMRQFGSNSMTYAYRHGRWKLILGISCTKLQAWGWSEPYGSKLVHNKHIPDFGTVLLFDLKVDPEERHDLSSKMPGIVEWLTKELDPYRSVGERWHISKSELMETRPTTSQWEPWL